MGVWLGAGLQGSQTEGVQAVDGSAVAAETAEVLEGEGVQYEDPACAEPHQQLQAVVVQGADLTLCGEEGREDGGGSTHRIYSIHFTQNRENVPTCSTKHVTIAQTIDNAVHVLTLFLLLHAFLAVVTSDQLLAAGVPLRHVLPVVQSSIHTQ